MTRPAFECVGFEPRKPGLRVNCGNCKNQDRKKCSVQKLLDELYAESSRFRAYDHMMRHNRGIELPKGSM